MDLINKYNLFHEDNTIIFRFDSDKDFICAIIDLKENFAEFKGKKIKVRFAQNGITTDLIDFGEKIIEDSGEINISLEKPVSASHIFITLPDGAYDKAEISIYELISENNENYYPAYFDTDLKENYFLDTVSVFTSPDGYSHYSVFTSLDGKDFEFLAEKKDNKPCPMETGDIINAGGRQARIIRVYIEYNTASVEALFDRVEFSGKKAETQIKSRPEIDICNFEDSQYNITVSAEDTFNEVYAIIERRLGAEYKNWFEFDLSDNPKDNGYDYFTLSDSNGKIKIQGNCGVSLAVGLNHYLKYYCKVNISQVGDQAKMPENIVKIGEEVFKETKAKVRYSYNYCTLSYSMAFWGEKEWRAELDWLALNGVNVVLDATAQEEVWRRFLTSLGYTHEEILKFIAGPAYYAWAYMANLSGFGGPVHDSWFAERTELARKNHLSMRKLGMYPVLQGFSGMVPNDICAHDGNAEIIKQGKWCSFYRPTMLRTTSETFKKYADLFYKAQAEVYGTYSIYYATDPFHEGGNVGDMSARDVSRCVLEAMLKENENAVWIIQSWQSNPTSELLKGLTDIENGKNHALILDLYAEKDPNYKKGHEGNEFHGYSAEFDDTPWVFCMLNNFGGRLGLHGHLDNLALWIPEAFNNCNSVAGIGITPEASMNNPVLYDFLFESVWRESADAEMKPINLNDWICDYAERRYGEKNLNTEKAWDILINTVYKAELNNLGQGAPESVVNARPALKIQAASTWGNAVISYEKSLLKDAARLLFSEFEVLKNSDGYKYDLVTILQQILSNTAQDVYNSMVEAFNSKNIEKFEQYSHEFLEIADNMDAVTGCSEYYMLGRWVEQAKALASSADDFSKKLYELNAKSLITTWGSYNQCELGGLHDYSNRQWSGLIKDYYKPRWVRWISERIKELKGENFEEKINWFSWEWNWARDNKIYNTTPNTQDLESLAKKILEK